MGELPSDLVSIQIHVSDIYSTAWGDQRASFYSVGGIPDTRFDGVVRDVGGSTATYGRYVSIVNQRLAVATDVTIDVRAVEVADLTYDVTATIGVEAGGTDKDLKIHIVQVLDNYPASSDGRYRNCVIDHQGSAETLLAAGESTSLTKQFVLSGASATSIENVKFVVFARDFGSPWPQEIHQAAWIGYPFTQDVDGDVDGDGDVDLADLAALLAAYGTCAGDPGYNPDADFNDDQCIDLSDLATLLANYGA